MRIRERDAVASFLAAAEHVGLEARAGSDGADDRGYDAVITLPGGSTIHVEIKASSLVTADGVHNQVRALSSHIDGDTRGLVVADRITAAARDQLNQTGIGWLDLRGHLRLVGAGLFVDSDVPSLLPPVPTRSGLSGSVGIELASLLLLDPKDRIGVRAAAKALSRAPSSVSEALAALRAADLVDGHGLPAAPELFWELADNWKPTSRNVASLPGAGRGRDEVALRLGRDHIESTVGWALGDTVAASVYGAPVSMRTDHPPDFYVPDQGVLRRAEQLLGVAATPAARAGRVRVAPVALVCTRRVDAAAWTAGSWPLAHPLFAALDLAQDPARGREILNGWTPREPWRRVW